MCNIGIGYVIQALNYTIIVVVYAGLVGSETLTEVIKAFLNNDYLRIIWNGV